jgi:hypothetical protein
MAEAGPINIEVSVNFKLGMVRLLTIAALGLESSGASPATMKKVIRPMIRRLVTDVGGIYDYYVNLLDAAPTATVYRVCRNEFDD